MKRKYEGLIILNAKGKDESIENMISSVGNEMESEGAKLEQIDHIGKRKFPYNARNLDEGFYVNYIFEAEADSIDRLRAKLDLNNDVHQQHYQRRSG
jgi:small subunit ribosomal protein S6